jgi:hypothetical protein
VCVACEKMSVSFTVQKLEAKGPEVMCGDGVQHAARPVHLGSGFITKHVENRGYCMNWHI